VSTTHPRRSSGGTSYEEVQTSAEFSELRSTFRKFVFPVTGLFLAWYFAYVLLAAFAPGFMSTKVVGNINIGLILGLPPVPPVAATAAHGAEGRGIVGT